MKTNPKLFNYTLSVGFILLIIVFLMSLILMSRHVLSDENVVGSYVSNTQNLLADVNEVNIQIEDKSTKVQIDDKDLLRLKFNNYQENIVDVSYLNINETKTLITIMLDSNIEIKNDVYYIKVDNLSSINKGYEILFRDDNKKVKIGKVFLVSNDGVKVLDVDSKEIVFVNLENILGKVVLEYEN